MVEKSFRLDMGIAFHGGALSTIISRWTSLTRRLAGLVLLGSMLITTSAGVALPPIVAAVDLLATLAERSPGAREAGVLSNKKARAPLEAPGGASRRIPDAPIPDAVLLPPDAGVLPGAGPDAGLLGGPAAVGGTDHFGSFDSFIPGSPGGFPVGGGPVGFAPPGGTPGAPGGGGGAPPGGGGGTTPPVTPVPEPGAWMLMLASFVLIGAQLRRRAGEPSTRCA